ncbi:MAG: hypothetical protein KAS86_05025, partial [Candidatus Omnitrophica bacterium]|nr:hypothetical protein [Candidatus Omnitrophota bacterium]
TGFIVRKIESGKDGRRFDIEEVAGKIEALERDTALREKISSHNIEYARERFYPEKVAKRLEDIYRRIYKGE